MSNRSKDFRELMRQVFDDCREGLRGELSSLEYEKARELFAFHMDECVDDLKSLASMIENSSELQAEDASTKIIGVLYHVVPHLAEAHRLLLDEVRNPFAADEN